MRVHLVVEAEEAQGLTIVLLAQGLEEVVAQEMVDLLILEQVEEQQTVVRVALTQVAVVALQTAVAAQGSL